MRPLTEKETEVFYKKLVKYIGRNVKYLIDRKDEEYCFRLHKDRVYYVSEANMRRSTNIDRKHLISLGTCFGKFTKGGNFRVHITALDYLAQYAQYKVWVKPSQEMSFLYGNHVLKSGLGRITDNCPEHQGVVVFTMGDVPIGFGTTAKSTHQCRKCEPTAIVVYHEADVGEYLREEGHLT